MQSNRSGVPQVGLVRRCLFEADAVATWLSCSGLVSTAVALTPQELLCVDAPPRRHRRARSARPAGRAVLQRGVDPDTHIRPLWCVGTLTMVVSVYS